MKNHDANRHPGPWRVMRVDSEFAGILVAVGFLVMGVVSMPIATWFVFGCLVLGGFFALLLRFTPKRFIGVVLGTVIILVVVVLWWAGRPPQRPHGVSSSALHVEPNNVGFTLHKTGYWLDCWFDKDANVDRCRLTNARGTGVFEDVFLPCVGQTPLPQSELVLNARWTGSKWTRSDKGINVPIVYVADGQVLLPRSFYAEARLDVHCSAD
ncbi:MAG TPA: hypothetical protein VGV15_19350 [Terriglobales bacterium]|nr:hypothetical protein [Terriglobales bacterium]